MTRNGKIARLPREIRGQLNHRLRNGEPGKCLVAWLNSLPETQHMLAAAFAGRPINEPNLSAWKTGGYLSWSIEQESLAQARQMPREVLELTAAANGRLGDNLATVLTARYAAALADWDGEATRKFRRKLQMLGGLCQNIVQLRRGDHTSARLGFQREHLDSMREKATCTIVNTSA